MFSPSTQDNLFCSSHTSGLRNTHNSCFFNVILQALAYSSDFVRVLDRQRSSLSRVEVRTLVNALSDILTSMWGGHPNAENIDDLGRLVTPPSTSSTREQEDSSETLQRLLELLNGEFVTIIESPGLPTDGQSLLSMLDVSSLFSSWRQTTFECNRCGHVFCHAERIFMLNVALMDDDHEIKLFKAFNTPTTDQRTCQACGSRDGFSGQIRLVYPAKYLVFAVNRSRVVRQGDGKVRTEKIMNPVETPEEFPAKVLTRDPSHTAMYKLYAVIYHTGETTVRGHYTVHCKRNAPNQALYYIDDEKVWGPGTEGNQGPVDENSVVAMTFYELSE